MTPSLDTRRRLDWAGPYSFARLIQDADVRSQFQVPGVYLWLDHCGIYYVGRASGKPNLWERHWQHYICLIAGHYQWPEYYRQTKKRWAMDPKDLDVVATVLDIAKYVDLVCESFEHVKRIQIFLCPLPQELTRVVERQLLYELQPTETKWGTKTPPKTWLQMVHSSAPWLTASTRRQIHDTVRFA